MALLSLLPAAPGASAQPPGSGPLGIAYFAIQHPNWPCDESLAVFNGVAVPRLAILWHTFGGNNECLTKFLRDQRPKVLQIHLFNETCMRDGDCGGYEPLAGLNTARYAQKLKGRDPELSKSIRRHARAVARYLDTHRSPNLSCYISPGLESNLDAEAAEVLFAIVRPIFPGCRFVWNPVGEEWGRLPAGADILELHGADPKLSPPCLANLDGVDIGWPDRPALLNRSIDLQEVQRFTKRFAACEAVFLWTAESNGISGNSFIDPRDRSNFPSPDLIRKLNEIIRK